MPIFRFIMDACLFGLAERMTKLGGAIVEALVLEYGKSEVLKRLRSNVVPSTWLCSWNEQTLNKYGGMTVMGKAQPPKKKVNQLKLF